MSNQVLKLLFCLIKSLNLHKFSSQVPPATIPINLSKMWPLEDVGA